MVDVESNLKKVLVEVDKAGGANLIAVSKFHDASKVRKVLDCGHRIFGENRVQEALGKWPQLISDYNDVELHLIGPLQTNKIKDALSIFDVIETLDRKKLADGIKQQLEKTGNKIECYVQVNTGEEEQKSGVFPSDADEFIQYCISIGLPLTGVMCIPPADCDPEEHFEYLAGLAKKYGFKNISMGMSGDYPIAIKYGATHVRVGTAIFGDRE